MPFTPEFKSKFGNIVFLVTAIGAIVTLISYVTPVVNYASNLNKLVNEYEKIHTSIERIESHIKDYEEDRVNKKKTYSIGLRGDTETGKIIYVDENNGIYRAFLNSETKQYFYYDMEGDAIYCYTKNPVKGEEKHIEIRPIVLPDSTIVTDSIN